MESQPLLNHLPLGFVLLLAAGAAAYDFRTGHIPNWLTYGGLFIGFACHFVVDLLTNPQPSLLFALLRPLFGLVACAFVPIMLHRQGAMGGGDVKLLAAVGASLGLLAGLEVELIAFVLLSLAALVKLVYEGRALRLLSNSVLLAVNPLLPKVKRREVPRELMTELRLGPAVLGAACLEVVLRSGGVWW